MLVYKSDVVYGNNDCKFGTPPNKDATLKLGGAGFAQIHKAKCFRENDRKTSPPEVANLFPSTVVLVLVLVLVPVLVLVLSAA